MSINYSTCYLVISGFDASSVRNDPTLFAQKESEYHGTYDEEDGYGSCLISMSYCEDRQQVRDDPNEVAITDSLVKQELPIEDLLLFRTGDEIPDAQHSSQEYIERHKKEYEPQNGFQTSFPFRWSEVISVLSDCDTFSYEKVAYMHQFRINGHPVTYLRYDASWEKDKPIEQPPVDVTLSTIDLYIQSTGYDHRLLGGKYAGNLEEFCESYGIEYTQTLVERPLLLSQAEKEIKNKDRWRFPFEFTTHRHVGIFLQLMKFLRDLGYCGCFDIYNMYDTQKIPIGDKMVLFSCVDCESGGYNPIYS